MFVGGLKEFKEMALIRSESGGPPLPFCFLQCSESEGLPLSGLPRHSRDLLVRQECELESVFAGPGERARLVKCLLCLLVLYAIILYRNSDVGETENVKEMLKFSQRSKVSSRTQE